MRAVCAQERMHSVMSHPAYQADPIAAIRRHLEATVKATEEAKELRAAVAGDGSGGTTADRRATSAAKKKAASARGATARRYAARLVRAESGNDAYTPT
jgi:hypothetical protein